MTPNRREFLSLFWRSGKTWSLPKRLDDCRVVQYSKKLFDCLFVENGEQRLTPPYSRICPLKTPARQPNPREYRRFSQTRKEA
jgi:hypothetical protein